jgi:hypothetical protein
MVYHILILISLTVFSKYIIVTSIKQKIINEKTIHPDTYSEFMFAVRSVVTESVSELFSSHYFLYPNY